MNVVINDYLLLSLVLDDLLSRLCPERELILNCPFVFPLKLGIYLIIPMRPGDKRLP
jgi:hypothetical protein